MRASVRPWRVVLGPHAAPGGRAATAAARSRAARSSGVVGAASATAGSGDSGSDSRQPGGRGSSSGRSGGGRASSADGRGRGSSASGGRGRGQSGGRGRGHSGGTGSGGPSVGRSSGGGAPDPPLLTAWIKNTDQLPVEQRLPSLQQLVERHAASFNFIHTAAAITQLGQWVGGGALPAASTHPLLQRLAPRLLQLLGECDAQAFANAVWACGKAGFADAALLDACLAQLAAKAAEADPQALSNALYGAALLQEQGYSIGRQQALQLFAALAQQPAAGSGSGSRERQQQAAKPQELSNALWAAATLGLAVLHQQTRQLVAALVEQRQAAKPQELSNTLWAAATLGLPLPAADWQSLLAALTDKAADTNPQHVSNTLWAAATQWGDKPEPRVAEALLQLAAAISEEQVSGMKAQEVANSLWALGVLGLCPGRLVAWLVAAVAAQLPTMIPQAISNTALGLARLGAQEAGLFGQLVAAAQERAAHLNEQDTCNLAWAAAVADQRQLGVQVASLCGHLAHNSAWSSMKAAGHRQLYQVHLWLADTQPAGGSSGLAGALSRLQLAECAAAWEEQLQQTGKQRRSELEARVFAAARCLACLADCRQEARTPDGAFSVDVAATHAPSGRLLAIEADGPVHFLLPGRQLSGDTAARNRALAARGYTVVSLPWWEWREAQGDDQAEGAYLQRKIDTALAGSSSGGSRQQQAAVPGVSAGGKAAAAGAAARLAAGLRQELQAAGPEAEPAGTQQQQQQQEQQQQQRGGARKRSRSDAGGDGGSGGGGRGGGARGSRAGGGGRKPAGGRGGAAP